jgi:hypothetical protein
VVLLGSDIFFDEPEPANAELKAAEEAGAALALSKQASMTLMVIEQDVDRAIALAVAR